MKIEISDYNVPLENLNELKRKLDEIFSIDFACFVEASKNPKIVLTDK